MITSRDTVVLKYKTCVILKLALSIIAGNLLHDKYTVELCNNIIFMGNKLFVIFVSYSIIGTISCYSICNRNR